MSASVLMLVGQGPLFKIAADINSKPFQILRNLMVETAANFFLLALAILDGPVPELE